MSNRKEYPFVDYLRKIRAVTDAQSPQWDAINGAMHELDDRYAAEAELLKKVAVLKKVNSRFRELLEECVEQFGMPDNHLADWVVKDAWIGEVFVPSVQTMIKTALTDNPEQGDGDER